MQLPPVNRIVTGHDTKGRSIVTDHGPAPNVFQIEAAPGTFFSELWRTAGSPALIDNGPDTSLGQTALAPAEGGTVVRVVDFPPETEDTTEGGLQRMREAFAQLAAPGAHTGGTSEAPRHPMMHRTETVDYGVVLEGQMTLVLDEDEVVVDPGTLVVQRGTNHAWANRSGRPCRMMFVLVDGAFDPSLAPHRRR
jgi:mannose-6-phosphate isomerase-like protein (cupin superfamily)